MITHVEVLPLEVPRGRVVLRVLPGPSGGKCYVYLPRQWQPGGPVLAAIHGISRNAREQALLFAGWAERHSFAVIAPLFSRENYRDYQRLGIEARGQRADRFFIRVLETFADWAGAPVERVNLFGYSGGGQFAHRFALLYPGRVAGLALGAPGWYTLPDERRAFPLGIAEFPEEITPDLAAWLVLPMIVLVGSEDNQRDPALRQSARLDRLQGLTRIERGQRFIAVTAAAARKRGLTPRLEFTLLPGVGHSFEAAMTAGGLPEKILPFLGLQALSVTGD